MRERCGRIIDRALTVLVVMLTITVVAVYLNLFLVARANADGIQEEVWVMCMPGSCVIVREKPKRSAAESGACLCGAVAWTEGKTSGGFLYVTELPAEDPEGWISTRYIVYDRPEEVNRTMTVWSQGRVACRKWIGGPVRGWVYDGDTVLVYWKSKEWSVTDHGYIKSEYLEEIV